MNTLTEEKRSDLINQGRRGRKGVDGLSRYERRNRSKVSSSTAEFNKIDMQSLFVHDYLAVKVPVHGETGEYHVKIKFSGFLDLLRSRIQQQGNHLDLRAVTRALLDAFNQEDVYISCNCADWSHRGSFWATMRDINSGPPERRSSKITNPHNALGPGCKHIMLVLSNNSWLSKVARVIYNYILYMNKTQQKLYAEVIYPAIYGEKYVGPVQLGVLDKQELDNTLDDISADDIDIANREGRKRGQFKVGNEYRYQPKEGPVKGQLSMDDLAEED